jgi:hypothetical protein
MQVGAIVSPRRCMVNQPDPVSPQIDSSCCAAPGSAGFRPAWGTPFT